MIDNFSKFSLALPFTLIVSACYLYGYWYTFDIDFYSYISVSEIAITSIIPLMFVGILSILGIAFGQWNIERKEHIDSPDKEKRSKIIQRIFDVIFIVSAIYTIVFGGSNKWLIIPTIVAIPLAIGIIKANFVDKEIIKANISIIFLIIYLSTQSFGYGKMKAQKILEGTDFRYVVTSEERCNPVIDQNKRYIGKIGEYVFIYFAKEKIVHVENFNNSLPLLLKEYNQSATCLTKT